jgi:hypothetical protein
MKDQSLVLWAALTLLAFGSSPHVTGTPILDASDIKVKGDYGRLHA